METKITPVWMKAVILSLITIIYGLILYFTDNALNRGLSYVNYCILIAGVIYFCVQFSKQKNADVTFGNVFAHGFKIACATAAILAIWSIIAIKFIYPDLTAKILEQARAEMTTANKMSADQIDQAITMTQKFLVPFMIAGIVLMYAIVGAIASLIGAGVAKKNPNPNPL